jgi:hypothetical protein
VTWINWRRAIELYKRRKTGPNLLVPNSLISPSSSKFSNIALQYIGELWKTARIDLGAFLQMYMFSMASSLLASPSVVSSWVFHDHMTTGLAIMMMK